MYLHWLNLVHFWCLSEMEYFIYPQFTSVAPSHSTAVTSDTCTVCTIFYSFNFAWYNTLINTHTHTHLLHMSQSYFCSCVLSTVCMDHLSVGMISMMILLSPKVTMVMWVVVVMSVFSSVLKFLIFLHCVCRSCHSFHRWYYYY